jgi:hypothetical protein
MLALRTRKAGGHPHLDDRAGRRGREGRGGERVRKMEEIPFHETPPRHQMGDSDDDDRAGDIDEYDEYEYEVDEDVTEEDDEEEEMPDRRLPRARRSLKYDKEGDDWSLDPSSARERSPGQESRASSSSVRLLHFYIRVLSCDQLTKFPSPLLCWCRRLE